MLSCVFVYVAMQVSNGVSEMRSEPSLAFADVIRSNQALLTQYLDHIATCPQSGDPDQKVLTQDAWAHDLPPQAEATVAKAKTTVAAVLKRTVFCTARVDSRLCVYGPQTVCVLIPSLLCERVSVF